MIDGKTFRLLGKLYYKERWFIFYSCDGVVSSAYLSLSEGLWRYAIIVDTNKYSIYEYAKGLLFKGDDYVTTTQMHMRLQCLLHEHLPTLKETGAYIQSIFADPATEEGYARMMLVTGRQQFGPFARELAHARKYTHPVFEPMNVTCRAECFKDLFSKIYSKSSAIRSAGGMFSGVDKYYKKMQELLGIGVHNSMVNSNIFKNESVINKEDRYRTLVSIYSAYMREFFDVVNPVSEYVCRMSMEIPGSFNPSTRKMKQMDIHVYKTVLRLDEPLVYANPSPPVAFDLYYGVYTLPPYYPTMAGTYKIIINLLPYGSSLDVHGLNDYYISAGIYVYKIFEYSGKQVDRLMDERYESFGNYSFIGDLLKDMWPLSVLREGPALANGAAAFAADGGVAALAADGGVAPALAADGGVAVPVANGGAGVGPVPTVNRRRRFTRIRKRKTRRSTRKN